MYPESSTLVDSFHIESHAALLQRTVATGSSSPRSLDAIIVPTIRPDSLGPAVELAHGLGCPIVVLCTTAEQAEEVRANSGQSPGSAADVFISYVSSAFWDRQGRFQTSGHPESDTETSCHIDISRKRNVGLLLARASDWRTIMFLDDDIRGMSISGINDAASQVAFFRAVGFEVDEFPDNSVVCHAHRLAGADQDVFPGGSAILVDVPKNNSFFPPIYNEDWLFLFEASGS